MSEQQPKRKSSSSNHWKVCYDLWRLRPIETEESSTSRASCVRIGEKMSLAGRRFRKFTMALDTDIVKDDRIHFRWKHQCCRRAALSSALHILFQKRWTRREKRARDSRPECRISSSNSIFRNSTRKWMKWKLLTTTQQRAATAHHCRHMDYGAKFLSLLFLMLFINAMERCSRRRSDEWIERNTQERKPKDSTFA